MTGAPGPRPLVIVGTGGHARELHHLVEAIEAERPGTIEVLGWLDSDASRHRTQVHGLEVLGGLDWIRTRPEVEVVVGIGAPQVRRRVVTRLRELGHRRFPCLAHPSAVVGPRVTTGEGVVLCAGVVITTDLRLGDHVHVNTSATLTHDDALGDYVTIAPGAVVSGTVTIGEGCDIGAGATVIQGVTVGAWSVVGAGAVVTRDLPAHVTAVGVPATVIKERPAGWHEG